MKRGPGPKRKTRLAPMSAVKRHQRKQQGLLEADLRRAFKLAAGHVCVMCRAFPLDAGFARTHAPDLRVMEAHHLLPKRDLKAHNLEEHLWDEANAIALCRYHHSRHETYRERLPRAFVPPAAFEFAETLGLGWLIDREYPS